MLLFNNFCSQELLELGIIPKEDCVLQMVCTFLYCVFKIYIKMYLWLSVLYSTAYEKTDIRRD